jgi:hypothetical protein
MPFHPLDLAGRLCQEGALMLTNILIIVLIILLIGALPRWPHSAAWGYGPSGGLGLIVLVLLILLLTGRL